MHVGVNELQWGGGAEPTHPEYNWWYKLDKQRQDNWRCENLSAEEHI